MKYTCDITVADSTEPKPSEAVEYQFFVKATDAHECLHLVCNDLQKIEPNRKRILDIWLEESDSPNMPFPDGDGIVHRTGPLEMTVVKNIGIRNRINKWLKKK